MAFGRSNSLSINTGASNSLFSNNNNAQAQKSSGLFGAATNTNQPQSGGLFGASTQAPQTAGLSTGGLFGSSTTTSQPQTAGLFGSTTPQTGGLFGSGNTQQQQTQPANNASGGGLFGANQNNNTGGGGLFGASASQPQQQQQGGGLFGNAQAQNQQQPQQQQGGGLFGGLNTQNKPAAPSLFGASANQTQQQRPSLFTNPSQQQGSSLFGGMPQAQAAPIGAVNQVSAGQQSVPGVIIDTSNLKPSTRFADCNEHLKKELTDVETFIQQQIQYHMQIAAFIPGHEAHINTLTPDVAYLTNRLESLETALDNDAADIHGVKATIKRDADEAKLSFSAIEQLKLPTQFHYPGASFGVSLPKAALSDTDGPSSVDMQAYFESKQTALAQAIEQHQRHVREIEEHLTTVQQSTNRKYNEVVEAKNRVDSGLGPQAPRQDSLRDLGLAFQAIETAILNTASKIGGVRENLVEASLKSRR